MTKNKKNLGRFAHRRTAEKTQRAERREP